MKWKVLPWPNWLSTQIRPSIIATRRLTIARPSPLPPYCRVVEESAWVKLEKTVDQLLRIPIPVSATEKCRKPSPEFPYRYAYGDRPASVNLTALPIRLIRIWRIPAIADEPGVASG